MPLVTANLADLKHAYQVLDVPHSASAAVIKQAYHKLAKRWHPDLYPSGSPQQAEAGQMMKLINEAYSTASTAPLRFYVPGEVGYVRATRKETHTRSQAAARHATAHYATIDPQIWEALRNMRQPPKLDRTEFWIRFVSGAIYGALVGFITSALMLVRSYSKRYHTTSIFDYVLAILWIAFCAYAAGQEAARRGDDFWRSTLGRHWFWS